MLGFAPLSGTPLDGGSPAPTGVAAASVSAFALSASGFMGRLGAGAADFPVVSASASGVVAQSVGSAGVDLPAVTSSGDTRFTRKGSSASVAPSATVAASGGLRISGPASATLPSLTAYGRDVAFRRSDYLEVWAINGPTDTAGNTGLSLAASINQMTLSGGDYIEAILDENDAAILDESGNEIEARADGAELGALVDLAYEAPNAASLSVQAGNSVEIEEAGNIVAA